MTYVFFPLLCLPLPPSHFLPIFRFPKESVLVLRSDKNVTLNARDDRGQLTGQLTVGECPLLSTAHTSTLEAVSPETVNHHLAGGCLYSRASRVSIWNTGLFSLMISSQFLCNVLKKWSYINLPNQSYLINRSTTIHLLIIFNRLCAWKIHCHFLAADALIERAMDSSYYHRVWTSVSPNYQSNLHDWWPLESKMSCLSTRTAIDLGQHTYVESWRWCDTTGDVTLCGHAWPSSQSERLILKKVHFVWSEVESRARIIIPSSRHGLRINARRERGREGDVNSFSMHM